VLAFCLAVTPLLARAAEPLLLVVMDPLAKELACACVPGYGQRDYRKLAARLQVALKHPMSVEFSDDLADSLAFAASRERVLVIGDRALVAHAARLANWPARPVCELTDREGRTSAAALFVARKDDPARELKDLAGRRVLVGLAEADARHAAARAALAALALEPPPRLETRGPGNEAALDVLDSTAAPPPVAVIPEYALPLLEGCGSISPGDLRVLGRSAPTPFITVFFSTGLAADLAARAEKALLDLKKDTRLLRDLESKSGFQPLVPPAPAPATPPRAGADWPDWRGPNRDGRVPRLPARLPDPPRFVWKKPAMPGCLAGLSVLAGRLVLAERDFADEHDVYRCLDAATGELLWRIAFPARGQLDYGQSPRAAPVLRDGRACLLGAFGGLRCVSLADGRLLWERDLRRDFQAALPTWGWCATPLLVDGLVIVNPGSRNAALAALDAATGQTRWTVPGRPAAYAAFVLAEPGGRRQIVGYDQESLGGWDLVTGRRLWALTPPEPGDFNVPTPLVVDGGLLVATENNGTRRHRFDAAGRLVTRPEAALAELAPDTATPVATAGRLFGVHRDLFCLDLRTLQPVWRHADDALGDHATLLADDARVLVVTLGGELWLLDARATECRTLSRVRVFEDDVEVYSHAALAGSRLYLRGGERVVCLDLDEETLTRR
jgi:outer membrane protein assembly factor BamB/ABC-type phosphate/phosphonate transport system substrate-binding protein